MASRLTRRSYLAAAVAIAFVVVLFFGGTAAWRLARRFDRPPPVPRQTDASQIAGWMSVPYVARAYRVPPPALFDALGISPEGRRMSTLDAIAEETGRSSEEVLTIVRSTVEAWQEANPPPERGAPKPDRPQPDRPKPERPPA